MWRAKSASYVIIFFLKGITFFFERAYIRKSDFDRRCSVTSKNLLIFRFVIVFTETDLCFGLPYHRLVYLLLALCLFCLEQLFQNLFPSAEVLKAVRPFALIEVEIADDQTAVCLCLVRRHGVRTARRTAREQHGVDGRFLEPLRRVIFGAEWGFVIITHFKRLAPASFGRKEEILQKSFE